MQQLHKLRFLPIILLLIAPHLSAQIIYDKFPQNMQLYPRDLTTNQAQITISGTAIHNNTFDAIQLRIYREGVIYALYDQTINPQTSSETFNFTTTITAELANYEYYFYTVSNGAYTINSTANNIVAGDAYIIDGQSNAVATIRNASAQSQENIFIRSFASSVNNTNVSNNLNWYQADADGDHSDNGNIGQWGAKMARELLDTYQVPIAILNGAYRGTPIISHLRNDSNPTDLTTNYGRLLYRTQQSGLDQNIRAILWYQGETDGKNYTSIANYKRYFYDLYQDWKSDYPNLEHTLIMQIRKSCNGNKSAFGRIQEAQRQLAQESPEISLMTAKGVPLFSDDCHFDYTAGYEEIGDRMTQLLRQQLFQENTDNRHAPNILSAEFIASDTLLITTDNTTDNLTWEDGAELDFFILGGNINIIGGTVSGNQIFLHTSGSTDTAYGLTYFGRNGAGVTAPFIKNTNGIGLASFYDFPIGTPVLYVNDDTYSMDEDTELTSNVTTNDFGLNSSGILVKDVFQDVNSGDLSLQNDGTFTYTPSPDFFGVDSFSYEICSAAQLNFCKTANVFLTINPINDAPTAVNDTIYRTTSDPFTTNILDNDFDIDSDSLNASFTIAANALNGSLSTQANGQISYQPTVNFEGVDEFMYEICDNAQPSLCTEAKVVIIIELPCVELDLRAILEGPFDVATQRMNTNLNTARKILPGQTPASNLVMPTPAGQPYAASPWNYQGTEGESWTDADYALGVVDWVLVSFRTTTEKTSEIGRAAALITENGGIIFPERCPLYVTNINEFFVVIEHRNHIGIMTPQPVPIVNEILTWDFSLSDSYTADSGFGQKEVAAGIWAMYAGDGDQISDDVSFDVNGKDKNIWVTENGRFDAYIPADYNLDGDTNGQDKSIWLENNGISSRVPK